MVDHVFSWHSDRDVRSIDDTNATIEVRKELRVLKSLLHISELGINGSNDVRSK